MVAEMYVSTGRLALAHISERFGELGEVDDFGRRDRGDRAVVLPTRITESIVTM